MDLNAYARGLVGRAPFPELSIPGTVVDVQWWARVPGFPPPQGVSLSNALEFIVGP